MQASKHNGSSFFFEMGYFRTPVRLPFVAEQKEAKISLKPAVLRIPFWINFAASLPTLSASLRATQKETK